MKKRSIFLMTGVAMLYFHNAYGQETVKDSTKVSSIDQVVITGNSNPKKKIESTQEKVICQNLISIRNIFSYDWYSRDYTSDIVE